MKTVQEILEDRRRQNEINLEKRRHEVFEKVPRIAEIEKQITKKNLERIRNLVHDANTDKITAEIEVLEKERDNLLEKNNFPLDYLEMKYHCDICKDTGVDGTKICSCRKKIKIEQLFENSEIEEILKRQNFDNFDLSLFRRDRQNGELISPYENMKEIKEELFEYATNFSDESLNLYLFGPVGTGKTFMINCIANEVLKDGHSVVYLTETDLVNEVLEYKYAFSEKKSELRPRFDSIFNSDLLIIDDLGSNPINENSKSAVFEVINKRLVKKLPVIISSNLNTEQLRAKYDMRIYSRIVGEYFSRHFYGNDIRISKWTSY